MYATHRCKTLNCQKRVRTYCTCTGDFGCVMRVSGTIVVRRVHVLFKVSQLDMLKICRGGDLAAYKRININVC